MRWRQSRRSSNLDDRRGRPVAGRGIKLGGGVGVLVLLAIVLLGGDPEPLMEAMAGSSTAAQGEAAPRPAAENELADMTGAVLAMTEDVWADVFRSGGQQYPPPTLVLFTDAVRSACGFNSAATGPFYCPPDSKVYIDLGFFDELQRMAGVSAGEFDFAAAYVIAHEVGHHVQNVLGTSDAVRAAQSDNPSLRNELSVLLELQADCYAGLWANRASLLDGGQILEAGDVEEGLRTAAAIGDDRLQRNAGRAVSPESFTHGTSEQRMSWLRTGLRAGSIESCDTFADAGFR